MSDIDAEAYRYLADAIYEHFNEFMQDGEEAEECLLVEGLKRARTAYESREADSKRLDYLTPKRWDIVMQEFRKANPDVATFPSTAIREAIDAAVSGAENT